jgi:nicotinic acid phosphoribosyltransferase
MNNIPLLFLTDSYKLSHYKAYPKAEKVTYTIV